MTTDAERTDIVEMNRKRGEIKIRTFDELRYFIRGDLAFSSCGYKDLADAADKLVRHAMKEMTKIEQEFLRKWPDK